MFFQTILKCRTTMHILPQNPVNLQIRKSTKSSSIYPPSLLQLSNSLIRKIMNFFLKRNFNELNSCLKKYLISSNLCVSFMVLTYSINLILVSLPYYCKLPSSAAGLKQQCIERFSLHNRDKVKKLLDELKTNGVKIRVSLDAAQNNKVGSNVFNPISFYPYGDTNRSVTDDIQLNAITEVSEQQFPVPLVKVSIPRNFCTKFSKNWNPRRKTPMQFYIGKSKTYWFLLLEIKTMKSSENFIDFLIYLFYFQLCYDNSSCVFSKRPKLLFIELTYCLKLMPKIHKSLIDFVIFKTHNVFWR